MTPLFLLRMWLRRAPLANRVSAAVSLGLVIALLAWIAVPGSSPTATTGFGTPVTSGGTSAQTAPQTTAVTTGPVPTGPAAAAPAAPVAASSGGADIAPAAPVTGPTVGSGPSGVVAPRPQTSVRPSAVVQSASAAALCPGKRTPLKVGVILPSAGPSSASLNGAFGVPPTSKQQAYYDAVFDTVNKSGGVRCHTLQPDYVVFNELSPSDTTGICAKFVQDKVFAALGGFQPGAPDTCLLQAHLPTIGQIMISEADAHRFYPYYMSAAGSFESVMKNFVYAVAQVGEFSAAKGFKKLGIALRSCIPSEMTSLNQALADKGITGSLVETFDFGCSNAPADPPSAVQQAVLQFQRDGVTHVTFIQDFQDVNGFTQDAKLQGYHPKYMVPDDGGFATVDVPGRAPDPQNFDGAIGITPLQYGGIAAGFPEAPATKKCDAIMTAHGQETVYKSQVQFAGNPCNLVDMLVAAMNAEPPGEVTAAGLAPALQKVGHLDFAYPHGPNDFRTPGVTWGGEGWREAIFVGSCNCFKAVTQAFSPSF